VIQSERTARCRFSSPGQLSECCSTDVSEINIELAEALADSVIAIVPIDPDVIYSVISTITMLGERIF
jgi:hypothetical protein